MTTTTTTAPDDRVLVVVVVEGRERVATASLSSFVVAPVVPTATA